MEPYTNNRLLDRINNLGHKRVVKIILLILFILSLIANGVQGYYFHKKSQAYRELKAIVDSKSNCEKVVAPVETPPETAPTTTTPTRYRGTTNSSDSSDSSDSSSTDTQETVIPPPPPPAD